MASEPLGARPLPFNIPTGIDAIKARDAEFWRLHAIWRDFEDQFESDPRSLDGSERSELMLERADAARDAMFRRPVRSAIALAAKLDACREGGPGSTLDMELQSGISVFDVIQWDIDRLCKLELLGPAAFDDMLNG